MLVLTRKQHETIKLGDDIIIKVIQTGRGSVKIGIEAPAHVRVLRGELVEFSSTTPAGDRNSDSHNNLPCAAPMRASKLMGFDAEYVADLEDQLWVATAS